jgi:hypothetical protein
MAKQITFSQFGNYGRLGNQLFQYASMIGLAKKHNAKLLLPPWKYAEYFTGKFPQGEIPGACREVKETVFHYIPDWPQVREQESVDIIGYLQSEKYWEPCIYDVIQALTFKPEFKQRIKDTFESTHEPLNNAIAISIRRGDYVGNPNYAQLPIISYYYLALAENFPEWRQRQIIIFSDDIPYCRVHFGMFDNVTFSENNSDIEDICLMSQCTDFVIGNSTFAWWGAYLTLLNGAKDPKVIRPKYHFDGNLLRKNDIKDYYPARWQYFDCKQANGQYKKIDLKDVTFTIPVAYDHEDRKENLNMCLRILQKNFDCSINVCEQVPSPTQEPKFFEYLAAPGSHYYCNVYTVFVYNKFWRTRILNQMARDATTKYIFNWDADVIIAPLQILQAVEMLRTGGDMVYPYKWAFARMPRNVWFEKIRNYEDIGMVGDTRFNGMNIGDAESLGGAVGFNRESFFKYGGENENFISYGAEDVERFHRFRKLGARIGRTDGETMYHMNHFVGPNSCPRHEDFAANDRELSKVRLMGRQQLEEYINTWPWKK